MYQTLIILGIVCIIAAAVGGGLTAFGVEIPTLNRPRVGMVLVIGAVLVVAGIAVRPKPTPSPQQPAVSSVTTDPVGRLSSFSCPVNVRVSGSLTTSGGQGQLVVKLLVTWDNGSTASSGPLTVSVDGANTYSFNDTWLVTGDAGGDFEWEVVSPISDGSAPQPFSVVC